MAAAVLLGLSALFVPGSAGGHPDRVAAAAAWLADELTANGNSLPSSYDPSTPDWGLTADAVLGLAAAGSGASQAAQAATDEFEEHVEDYFTGSGFDMPDERYSGPIGKALLLAKVQGRDASDFGGWDLDTESRARMQTSGDQAGRFSDDSEFGDFSNGFAQALNIMGLARTTGGVPAQAITFLLDQQCPSGAFRLFYEDTAGCDDDAEADTDATAFAVQALLTATTSEAAREAIVEAVAWLVVVQQDDGGFSGTGTGAANANTTGLAGQALLAAKQADPAEDAHSWGEARQLTSDNAGAASDDVGAIARDSGAMSTAQANGIPDSARDTWRRATAQGILALGLPAYSQIALPIPPPTADLSDATAHHGDQVTVVGARFAYVERITVTFDDGSEAIASGTTDDNGEVAISFVVPALSPGAHEVVLSGAASDLRAEDSFTVVAAQPTPTTGSASTTSAARVPTAGPSGGSRGEDDTTPRRPLAATGSDPAIPGTLGLTVVVAGLLLLSLARLRCGNSRSH